VPDHIVVAMLDTGGTKRCATEQRGTGHVFDGCFLVTVVSLTCPMPVIDMYSHCSLRPAQLVGTHRHL
jgi:hypothetical protein